MPKSSRLRFAWICVALVGCVHGRFLDTDPDGVFQAEDANRGSENYSAWFGDSDGRVIYFGLSPFWELWWAEQGDSSADLREPGDHLIGRFDLQNRVFLSPLLVRAGAEDVRSSVWDVLAHSNGRVYYSTYFEELGWVDPETGEVGFIEGHGVGFNEIVEGPGGNLYITRYSNSPSNPAGQSFGGLVVLTPDGEMLREVRFGRTDRQFTAPKSVAVDPKTGEVWLNADVFLEKGGIEFAMIHLDAEGKILERASDGSELMFMDFDASGNGYFVVDDAGTIELLVRRAEEVVSRFDLGPRIPGDFAQDLQINSDGEVAISFWSGSVVVSSERAGQQRWTRITLPKPRRCNPPRGRSVTYSAFIHEQRVYATLYCGASITSAPIPE